MKLNKLTYFSFALALVLANTLTVKAQSNKRKTPTQYITEQHIDQNLGYTLLDTNMNETEIFHQMYQKQRIFQDLGNIASAGRNSVFSPFKVFGFNPAFNPYENYFFTPNTAKYYNTSTPFTELTFAQGAKELLFLKATHAQNINPRWSAAIDYQRITSDGFFFLGKTSMQKTSMYNVHTNTRYFSKNKRYEIIAHANWNYGYQQESGGIQNDSVFEHLSGATKNVSVNLNHSQNAYNNRSILVKQYYRFGSPIQLINQEDTLYDFKTKAQLAYTIKTNETSNVFTNNGDTVNPLLPNQFLTQTANQTYDSVYSGLLENNLSLQLLANVDSTYNRFLSVGITHQAMSVAQPLFLLNYQNVLVDANLRWDNLKPNTFSFGVYGAYALTGYNNSDFKTHAAVKYKLSGVEISAQIGAQKYRPEYNYYRFTTNQFIWNNNLNQTQTYSQQLALKTTKLHNNFSLKINHYTITNNVYLGNNLTPEQDAKTASVWHVEVAKTFQLKKFYFTHQLNWQQSSSANIPVPQIGGMIRYYYQTPIFSSLLQVGVDVFYNSSYYAMGWSPASRMFYLQNQIKVGNYALVNPFINMQIKRAVVFFIYEHANQNLINKGFYNTPHYPISLTSFRMGVRWRMYN